MLDAENNKPALGLSKDARARHNLEQARAAVAVGLYVMPIRGDGKSCLTYMWPRDAATITDSEKTAYLDRKDAEKVKAGEAPLNRERAMFGSTVERKVLAAWFQRHPGCSFGLNAGLSGLVVLDGDTSRSWTARLVGVEDNKDAQITIMEKGASRYTMHKGERVPVTGEGNGTWSVTFDGTAYTIPLEARTITKGAGADRLRELMQSQPDLFQGAAVVNTPSGGLHIIFRNRADNQIHSTALNDCTLDVIAAGKQALLAGTIRADGKRYTLDPAGSDLFKVGAAGLPEISQALIDALNLTVASGATSGATPDPVEGIDLEALRDIVAAIPNEDRHWDDFIRIGGAIHHQTAGDPEGLEIWEDWASKADKYEAGRCEKEWPSLHRDGRRATVHGLLWEARQHGYEPAEHVLAATTDDGSAFGPVETEGELIDVEIADATRRLHAIERAIAEIDALAAKLFDVPDEVNEAAIDALPDINETDVTAAVSELKDNLTLDSRVQTAMDLGNVRAVISKAGRDIRAMLEKQQKAAEPFRFKSAWDFMLEYEPAQYLIEPLLQRGYVYAVTGSTGAGKTLLLTTSALAVCAGRGDLLGRNVEKGRVLYLTFENPIDFRMKLMAAAERFGIGKKDLIDNLMIEDARLGPKEILKRVKKDGRDFALVIVDTLAAGFAMVGSDTNDQIQTANYVRDFRPLSLLPSKPTVLMACHPVKNAPKDNLIPYGAGALLNEFDGNFSLWKDKTSGVVELHWQGKLRGLDFEPIQFRTEVVSSQTALDAKGQPMRLPVLTPASFVEAAAARARAHGRDLAILTGISLNTGVRQNQLATMVGVSEATVSREIKKLEEAKFLKPAQGGGYALTNKGKEQLIRLQNETNEFAPVEDDEHETVMRH